MFIELISVFDSKNIIENNLKSLKIKNTLKIFILEAINLNFVNKILESKLTYMNDIETLEWLLCNSETETFLKLVKFVDLSNYPNSTIYRDISKNCFNQLVNLGHLVVNKQLFENFISASNYELVEYLYNKYKFEPEHYLQKVCSENQTDILYLFTRKIPRKTLSDKYLRSAILNGSRECFELLLVFTNLVTENFRCISLVTNFMEIEDLEYILKFIIQDNPKILNTPEFKEGLNRAFNVACKLADFEKIELFLNKEFIKNSLGYDVDLNYNFTVDYINIQWLFKKQMTNIIKKLIEFKKISNIDFLKNCKDTFEFK